jgi:serpin B
MLLPYGKSSRMSMLIALPQAGVTLDAMVTAFTTAQINSSLSQVGWEQQVSVGLPRFTTRYSTSLVPALTALGMGVAFSEQDANFSALAPRHFVSFVQHATVVQVDEAGTVAAGSTSVGTSILAGPTTMTMDHPFLYAIRDDQTGVLLFVGLMFDPSQS